MAQVVGEDFVRKTYRYLRIGLLVSVLMLGVSIALERLMVACWQTSISGYYYTPVRAVFVSSLVAIGLAMIAIKGQGREDLRLNIAGMLAPVVAFVPTQNVNENCWSSPPVVYEDGHLEEAIQGLMELMEANVLNNLRALAIAGLIAVAVAAVLLAITERDPLAPFSMREGDAPVRRGLLATVLIIGVVWGLYESDWEFFRDWLHNLSAIGMFAFVALASLANYRRLGRRSGNDDGQPPGTGGQALPKARRTMFRTVYLVVPLAMALAAVVVLFVFWIRGEGGWLHAVLVLEIAEIVIFFVYWIFQTVEHWDDPVSVT